MGSRILWLNPVGFDAYDVPIGDALRAEARPDTRIDVASLSMPSVQQTSRPPTLVLIPRTMSRTRSNCGPSLISRQAAPMPACTEERILEEARKAVEEDGADVIVLGCTIEFGFYQKVQDELGVPVVDAIVAPIRYAEFLADLSARHGWHHSNAGGYESPAADELNAWVPVVQPLVSHDPR